MFELFMPLLMKILGVFVEKYFTDNETKKKYYEFLDVLSKNASFSVKLQKLAEEQKERLQK